MLYITDKTTSDIAIVMATNSSELEKALEEYIDSPSGDGRNRLRKLLMSASLITRLNLLLHVRGRSYTTWTGLHGAALSNDLESITCMLFGLTSSQKYDVLKIQTQQKETALHKAAFHGHSTIVAHFIEDLSEQQKYDLLKLQDSHEDTVLHNAASQEQADVVQVILASVSSQSCKQLMRIKNKSKKTFTDTWPQLNTASPPLNHLSMYVYLSNTFGVIFNSLLLE